MQLLGQNEGGLQQQQQQQAEGGSPRSASEGDGPVSPSSSPGSPSKAAAREKPVRVLPCPRCQSMNTKFCYYNNYSVAQPRHFCRQCQRYWTAGGTLRNVPVGGGSRKKNRHASRAGEPYLQQQQQQQQRAHAAGPFGVPAPPLQQQQNVGFQQMLAQDANNGMVALNFPGFYSPGAGYASLQDPAYAYNQPELPPSMHAMYGTGPANAYYEMAAPSENVKQELWSSMMPPPPPQQQQNGSTLLNLGLNRWDQAQHAELGKTKNGSPPHGSSTIEEEGSTPTNGYSTRGYEEGDAVSSMWHSLHDSDAMFQESMFQLSNPEDQR